MAKPLPPADPDRVIAPGTVAQRGRAGDANALWRYERHRRQNLRAEPGPLPVVLVLERLRADFNVPKIFRSAQALGARAIHLVGVGPFDPAPAKGAFKHVPARFHEDFGSCRDALLGEGYTLFALHPHDGALLPSLALPERSAFILGHEQDGLSAEVLGDARVTPVRIPHAGALESLNVAVAASIALYEYARNRSVAPP
ncbi:MAG: TrmH family RNA methyltransferase [Lysobacteraceae bacterium]